MILWLTPFYRQDTVVARTTYSIACSHVSWESVIRDVNGPTQQHQKVLS